MLNTDSSFSVMICYDWSSFWVRNKIVYVRDFYKKKCFALHSQKVFMVTSLVIFNTQVCCDLTITTQKDAYVVLLS